MENLIPGTTALFNRFLKRHQVHRNCVKGNKAEYCNGDTLSEHYASLFSQDNTSPKTNF